MNSETREVDDVQHYSKLRRGRCNYLVPPNYIVLLSGAQHAKQVRDGTITLTYTDGSEESRKSDKDLVSEFDGFFAVVSFVQASHAENLGDV